MEKDTLQKQSVDRDSDEIDLASIFKTLWRYRYIFLIVLLLTAFLSGAFIVVSAFIPLTQSATVQVQMEFKGAQAGQYPNGMEFSSGDMLLTPNLDRVYQAHELNEYMTFDEFRNALIVRRVESARFLSRIQDLQDRLAGNIPLADRERIHAELEELLRSQKSTQFKIHFMYPGNAFPVTLAHQVLNDVLHVWAEDMVVRLNVLEYRVPVLSPSFINRDFILNEDYFISLDILRQKCLQVLENLSTIKALPGGELVRTAERGISLPEVEMEINNLITFSLEPLVGVIRNAGLARNRQMVNIFLLGKMNNLKLERAALEDKAKIYAESLQTYAQDLAVRAQRTGLSAFPESAPSRQTQDWPTSIPQIGESFIDMIVNMAGRAQDQEFKQELIRENIEFSLLISDKEQELAYYQMLYASLFDRQVSPEIVDLGLDVSTEFDIDFPGYFAERFLEIINQLESKISEINQIYFKISEDNLNPQKGLYSVSIAPRIETETRMGIKKAGVLSVLFVGGGMFLAMIGVFIHAAIRSGRETVRA